MLQILFSYVVSPKILFCNSKDFKIRGPININVQKWSFTQENVKTMKGITSKERRNDESDQHQNFFSM